jgi:hypothetical protein
VVDKTQLIPSNEKLDILRSLTHNNDNMAVHCELDIVVEHVRTKIQTFYETLKKDAVAECLYTEEGPPGNIASPKLEHFMYSKSLDKDLPILKQPTGANATKSNEDRSLSPKKKFKVVTFTSTSYTHGVENLFTFEKEKLPHNAPAISGIASNKIPTHSNNVSALTKLLKPDMPSGKGGSALTDDVLPSMGGLTLTIHTWHPCTLKVNVFEKASVGQVITSTLKQFPANKLDLPPTLETSAYSLRIADSSGQIDDDYPALDEKQSIYKFKNEHFILCKSFRMPSDDKERRRTLSHRPRSQMFTTVTPSSPSADPSIIVFKINLPDKSTSKVQYQPDLKLSDLLKQICKKRVLFPSDHYFTVPGSDQPCNLNLTMDQISGCELTLCENVSVPASNSGGDDSSITSKPEIFWYDGLAFQYRSYDVVKIKKYGAKQERVLGIDKDRIANMPPTLNTKKHSAKRPSRFIRDVTRITDLENKPKQFIIEYSDGKTYTYEAKTPQLAREIVGKISYLKKSEQLPHS